MHSDGHLGNLHWV